MAITSYAVEKSTEQRGHRGIQFHLAGGTILSEPTPYGLMPVSSGEELLRRYAPEIVGDACVTQLKQMDSTDMHFEDYKKVAESIVGGVRNGHKSHIVVQGTDTMPYGAAFLSLRLPFKDYHVGIVGSMYPIGEGSDALCNLRAAFAAAEQGWPGTYVIMNNGEVLRASRAVKTRANKVFRGEIVPEVHSFQSLHYPVLARLSDGSVEYTRRGKSAQKRFLKRKERDDFLRTSLADLYRDPVFLPYHENVYVIDLHPNFDPDQMDQAFETGYRAAVIRAPGTGGVSLTPAEKNLVERINRWTRDGRYIVITSRVPNAIVDRTYEVNRRSEQAGAVLCYDMHPDLVIAKTELASAIADSPEDFTQVMQYNFEDEIRESLVPRHERTTDEQLAGILERAFLRDKNNGNGSKAKKFLGIAI